MMLRLIPIVSVLLIVQAYAESDRFTGKVLFDLCASSRTSNDFALCTFYVNGFVRGVHTAMATAEEYQSNVLCLPDGLTTTEAISEFLQKVRSFKDAELKVVLHNRADLALALAIGAAFPCRKTASLGSTQAYPTA
jgi:Rap1a immunity proteins